MLHLYTGRARLLAPALIEAVKTAPANTQLVIVPKQLTLQTERMLLDKLNLRGSFRIQVMSAERLCLRIFEAAGQPEGTKIDERGRVMLIRAAVRAAEPNLTIYRGAHHRRGFPERAAEQLEHIRQAQVNADTLRACAAELSGSARMKLNDLSYILEAYEDMLEGRYQDGDSEFNAAVRRARDAAFLKECDVWFFGFDMVPPTLHELMAAVAASTDRCGVFLPLENNESARDFDAFQPMQKGLERLVFAAKRQQTAVERIDIEETAPVSKRRTMIVPGAKRKSDLALLERELFAYPAKPAAGAAKSIQLTLLRNPLEECMFAAALARRLVIQRGWKWDDILILCRDLDGYSAPLRTAFHQYDVPLFLASSRSAARHATSECLLTAMKVIEKNYPAEDMIALMRTGLMPIDTDEADRFANYTVKYGLRGVRFMRPLTRGGEAEIDAIEPIRARFVQSLTALKENLKAAATLPEQLAALFGFLTEIKAYEKSQARMIALAEADLREAASEEGQVWNRILGAMDQMHALMGEKKLSLRELNETLTESLSASVIKALPQSGDAVYAQSTNGACARTAKAMIVLGMSDRPVSEEDGLLTPNQKQALSQFTGAYLGPDDADLSRLKRFYLKSALGMAEEYVSLSCPLSGGDGAAQRPGAMFEMIEELFPGTKTRGGLTGDANVERMLRGAPEAAVAFASRALAGEGEGVPSLESDRAALAGLKKISDELPKAKDGLKRLSAALNRAQAADALNPDTAKKLYGMLHRQSITQLELFAACPFSYYARYGLRPEKIEPFELNARDEGTFFHSAVNEFLMRSMDDLNNLDAETAARRMDAISDVLLDAMGESGPLGDSAVAGAEKRRLKSTARVCAAALADHMRGSSFHTSQLETSFGREDGSLAIRLPNGCILEGRIDRVDEWSSSESDFLRVIDYKRGGKSLKLSEAYYGLRLQLPVYLAAAQKRRGSKSAGVYYFTLSEGILATQSTDPFAVAADRRKEFRMDGLLPESKEVLKAMSPNFSQVLNARVTQGGDLYKGTVVASEADFNNLTRCAIRRAGEHVDSISAGECTVSPARMDLSDPCRYCDYRAICQFDDRLDADRIRKFKPIPAQEVLERLREEETPGENSF